MTWLRHSWPQVLELGLAHLALALPAIALSVLLAVPLGWLSSSYPRLGGPLATVTSLLYAVPALPLLVVVPVVLGVPLRSATTVVTALTVYGVALMVRSASDAFTSVDATARAGAVAVGHSRRSLFWRVELPLATPVLVAGLRVVSVSTVSLVTIGALVGVSSLGTLLTDGFQRGIVAEVATGVLGTCLLAVLLDVLWLALGRAATPWTRAGSARLRVRRAAR